MILVPSGEAAAPVAVWLLEVFVAVRCIVTSLRWPCDEFQSPYIQRAHLLASAKDFTSVFIRRCFARGARGKKYACVCDVVVVGELGKRAGFFNSSAGRCACVQRGGSSARELFGRLVTN